MHNCIVVLDPAFFDHRVPDYHVKVNIVRMDAMLFDPCVITGLSTHAGLAGWPVGTLVLFEAFNCGNTSIRKMRMGQCALMNLGF